MWQCRLMLYSEVELSPCHRRQGYICWVLQGSFGRPSPEGPAMIRHPNLSAIHSRGGLRITLPYQIYLCKIWIGNVQIKYPGFMQYEMNSILNSHTTLTHDGPTRSPASWPESAERPMALTRVTAGLPGSQHAYNPHFPRTSGHWAARSLD